MHCVVPRPHRIARCRGIAAGLAGTILGATHTQGQANGAWRLASLRGALVPGRGPRWARRMAGACLREAALRSCDMMLAINPGQAVEGRSDHELPVSTSHLAY